MSDPQKKSLITIAIGVVIAALGGASADAAGLTPDPALIRDLGIGGAVLLIVYLEYRIRPLGVAIVQKLGVDAATVKPDAAVEEVVEIVTGPVKRQLAVVPKSRASTEPG
jgi:hypothetical protein